MMFWYKNTNQARQRTVEDGEQQQCRSKIASKNHKVVPSSNGLQVSSVPVDDTSSQKHGAPDKEENHVPRSVWAEAKHRLDGSERTQITNCF
jgi:hypothetical protein